IHRTVTVLFLWPDRAPEGFSPRRVRAARPQLLSRGRFSAGSPLRMDRQSIAVVIPAFNEEKHIGDVVRRTRAKLDHVLVVDDGSSDATASEARTAGADVIAHSENRGKGEAIKTGLRHWLDRQSTWVFILDADAQHRPEEIDHFLNAASASDAKMFI